MTDSIKFVDSSTYFRENISVYQKIVNLNYLKHREIYSAIQSLFDLYNNIHNFLDLGCGDASQLVPVLPKTINKYVGIDISMHALSEAENNIKLESKQKEFIQGDFAKIISQMVRERPEKFDVVFSSYSFHHLQHSEKSKILSGIYQLLNPQGFFVLVDLFLRQEETRQEFLSRYFSTYMKAWKLSPTEEVLVQQHMIDSDLLESTETIKSMALAGGFSQSQQLYKDNLNFFEARVFFK